MEILTPTSNELYFVFFASYMLLIAYYYQYINLYNPFFNREVIFNRELIEYQLNMLHKDLKVYKYKFWSYQFTVFTITPILFIFNIGEDLKYFWLGLSLFLLFQYILEYRYFLLEILVTQETTNKSISSILDEYETSKQYEKIKLNKYQKDIIQDIKDLNLTKSKVIKLEKETKLKLTSFLEGSETENTNIKISEAGIRYYNKKGELLELDLEDFILSKINEINSSYYHSFNERIFLNKTINIGILEPIVMSLLLFGIISIKF